MGKLLMALRYGSIKTKITLISIALLLIGGGALLVIGIKSMSFAMLGIGAILLIGGLLFILSLSVIEKDIDRQEKPSPEKTENGDEGADSPASEDKKSGKKPVRKKGRRFGRSLEHGVPANREYAGVIPEWQNDIIVSKLVGNNDDTVKASGTQQEKEEKPGAAETRPEAAGVKPEAAGERREAAAVKRESSEGMTLKEKEAELKADSQIMDFAERGVIANVREQRRLVSKKAPESYPEDEEVPEKEKRRKHSKRAKADTDNEESEYRPDGGYDDEYDDEYDEDSSEYEEEKPMPTKKQLQERKKLLRLKGGDKKYTPVFVDSFKGKDAECVPAYIQTKGKTVNVILIEGTLRTIVMPMNRFIHVSYERSVPERHPEYYENLRQDEELSETFGDLLPSLYRGTGRNVMTEYKNRYILGGDLAVSPRSMRLLMKKFDFDYHVFDSLEIKGEYTDYFKMAYENRIFWTDNCITQTEYQNRTRRLLQMMVDDDSIAQYDFQDDLDLMVKYMLITREYADFYKARKKDKIKIKI